MVTFDGFTYMVTYMVVLHFILVRVNYLALFYDGYDTSIALILLHIYQYIILNNILKYWCNSVLYYLYENKFGVNLWDIIALSEFMHCRR